MGDIYVLFFCTQSFVVSLCRLTKVQKTKRSFFHIVYMHVYIYISVNQSRGDREQGGSACISGISKKSNTVIIEGKQTGARWWKAGEKGESRDLPL